MNTDNINNTENSINFINRFDRQNRVYGIESTAKLQHANVFLIGQKSDALFEIAKNLVLSGVQNLFLSCNYQYKCSDITALSDDMVQITFDDNSNFFGNIHNIDECKIINEITNLNPYSNVQLFDISTIYNNSANIRDSVLIFVNHDLNQITRINNILRNNSNKFIAVNYYEQNHTLTITNDFNVHHILDIDGENYDNHTILDFTSNNNTYHVTTNSSHDLSVGDKIHFELIVQNCDSTTPKIEFDAHVKTIIGFNIFTFEYDTHISHFINGNVQKIKEHVVLQHKSLDQIFDAKLLNLNCTNISTINPVVQSFIGAVVASEAIKAITSKYIPFDQTYDFAFHSDVLFRPNHELLLKLNKLKFFIVGSGAIGCELLKNLAMIGAQNISITDPDHIEISNLSRQFLFRSNDVQSSKSIVAAKRITQYNPNVKITAYQDKLSDDNSKFSNHVIKSSDIVFNALDNIQARLFVDKLVVKHTKPLFESGTLGTKGNTQPIIPFVTESYGASKDQEQEKTFPACTIKNFPSTIHHTIHFAMDDFNGLFNKQPTYLQTFLTNDKSFNNVPGNELSLIKMHLHKLFDILPKMNSVHAYIHWAYCLWFDRHVRRINKLITSHPPDHLTESRTLFWSNGKKCPNVGDIYTPQFTDYIFATTNLLLTTYYQNFSTDNILDVINSTNFSELDPNFYVDDSDIVGDFAFPNKSNFNPNIVITPQDFEKDDDSNYHVAYITATSNNRAICYGIKPISQFDTKGIAGNIIPALATTTSIVSSLITLEMLKFVTNPNRTIEDYQSYYVNIANNFFLPGEPLQPKSYTVNNVSFTEWSSFCYNSNITINSFREMLSKQFDTNIALISLDQAIIYSDFSDNFIDCSLYSKIINLLSDKNTNSVQVSIFSDDDNIDLPQITINLTNNINTSFDL